MGRHHFYCTQHPLIVKIWSLTKIILYIIEIFHFKFNIFACSLQIDNVRNPSWQAQITGKKKWTLEPPPECYDICPEKLEVIVMPGDISELSPLLE